MTRRSDKITEYYERLSIINEETEKYDEIYKEFIAYLNSDDDKYPLENKYTI